MTAQLPKVSVIIPHFNMASFLAGAVQSVASQQYENVELIIVDDGSDETINDEQFLASDQLPVKVVTIQHQGKPAAVNCGFEESEGEYLVILDADDQLPADSLSNRVAALEENDADLCIGSFEVGYKGIIRSKRDIRKLAGCTNKKTIRTLLTSIISPFHQNAMMFSRDLLARTGKMDPKLLRSQDKDFAIRLLHESRKTIFIGESVYIYNRYDRPLSKRVYHRLLGWKYKLLVIGRYSLGWRRSCYMAWGSLVEAGKLIHDLFGVYKK